MEIKNTLACEENNPMNSRLPRRKMQPFRMLPSQCLHPHHIQIKSSTEMAEKLDFFLFFYLFLGLWAHPTMFRDYSWLFTLHPGKVWRTYRMLGVKSGLAECNLLAALLLWPEKSDFFLKIKSAQQWKTKKRNRSIGSMEVKDDISEIRRVLQFSTSSHVIIT